MSDPCTTIEFTIRLADPAGARDAAQAVAQSYFRTKGHVGVEIGTGTPGHSTLDGSVSVWVFDVTATFCPVKGTQ